MTAKTKYIVIALLLIVLACTSVGLSTWNIHYQANVGEFEYKDTLTEGVEPNTTTTSILDSYIYFENANLYDKEDADGNILTDSNGNELKTGRLSYPVGNANKDIFTYTFDGDQHSPTVFVPTSSNVKGDANHPLELFLDDGELDVDWGITDVFGEIGFKYNYRLVSMPYVSDHKGNSDNYCEITSINYNGTTATVYFTWKNGNGEHQGTNIPVALINNNGSYNADENHDKIDVTFEGTNAIITVKGFTPFTIDMTAVANAGYTTTAPTNAGVYECRISAKIKDEAIITTENKAIVNKVIELLNANGAYVRDITYAILPATETMTQGETKYEKESQQKQLAKRTTLGTAPLSDTTNTVEVSEEGTVTIEIGESQKSVSFFTYKGATYQISFSATINNKDNTNVLFTLELENDAHNISNSNDIDSSYVYSTYGFSSDPNYQISNPVVYYSILKREIKVNAWTANTFEYNGQKQYPTVSSPASDSASMYDATLEYFWMDNDAVSTTAPINANTNGGNYTVWVALDKDHRGNYFLTVGDANVDMIDTYVNDATTPRIGYNYTITPKEIGVDWDESTLTFTYDGTKHVPTATATGLVSQNGVLDTCNITVTGGKTDANAKAGSASYTATADSLDNTNYKLADPKPTTTFVINQKQVGVTWGTTIFTYNGSKQKPTATVNPGDLCGADECTVTVTGEKVNAGTNYTATASSLSNLNYKLTDTNPTTTFTINPKTIGISWTNTTFTYDGKPHKPTATATGLESQDGVPDTCTITVDGEQTNAGTHTATASSLSNSNYQLPSDKTEEFTINKRTITIAWSNLSFTYDGANKIPTAVVGNLVTGDDCTITVTGEQVNAGTYTATASSISGTSSGNYQLPTANTTSFTIAQKSISGAKITLSEHEGLTYNGTEQTVNVDSVVIDGLKATFTHTGNTGKDAKTYTITVTGNGNFTGTATTTWSIAKKDISGATITLGDALTYTGATQTQSIASVTVDGVTGEITYTTTGDTQTDVSAENYILTITGNGNFEGTATKDWNITPATNNWSTQPSISSWTYGQTANAPAGASEFGEVAFTYYDSNKQSLGTTQPTNAGNYYMVASVEADGLNYDAISTDYIAFTVKQKEITLDWGETKLPYDGTEKDLAPEPIGIVEGDTCTVTISISPSPAIEAGTYSATFIAISNKNYVLSDSAIKTQEFVIQATIDGAEITLSGHETLVYNGMKQTVSIVSVKIGDIELNEIDYTIEYKNNINAGEATITFTGAGNYTGTTTKTFKIAKAPLTITAKNKSITYGDTIPTYTVTYSGFVNNETASVLDGTLKFECHYERGKNAGSYPIIPSGYTSDNYHITYKSGSLSVEKRKISITSAVLEFSYGETDATKIITKAKANVTGIYENDSITDLITIKYTNGSTNTNGELVYSTTDSITVGNTYRIDYTLTNTATTNYQWDDDENSPTNTTVNGNTRSAYYKYKTAMIGTSTPYYTIEDAIANMDSNTVTMVGDNTGANTYVETSFTQLSGISSISGLENYTGTYTITSGKLLVPHKSGTTTAKETGTSVTSHNVYAILIIPQGVILNINGGSLEIGAHISLRSTGVINGTTTSQGYHGVLINDGTINIGSGASMSAYGYVKSTPVLNSDNTTVDTTGWINLANGSKMTEAMHILDWIGGNSSTKVNGYCFPSNAWSLHTVACKTKINSGAKYYGYFYTQVSLSFLGTQGADTDQILLIGSSSDTNCLFIPEEISTNNYIVKQARPKDGWSTDEVTYKGLFTKEGSHAEIGQKDILEINGSYTDQSLSITISQMGQTITMESSLNVSLPITYMDITLKSGGNLTLSSSDFFFMPGTTTTIEENAHLTVEAGVDLAFLDYSTLEDVKTTTNANYDFSKVIKNTTTAQLILNGTADIYGSIGGVVTTNTVNASIDLTNASTTASFTVIKGAHGAGASISDINAYYVSKITDNIKGPMVDVVGNWTEEDGYKNFSADTYYSNGNGWYTSGNYTLTYNMNYTGSNSETLPKTNGTAITDADLTKTPTRTGYKFDGWFADADGNVPVDTSQPYYGNITIYAHWTANKYNVTFNPNRGSVDSTSNVVTYASAYGALPTPTRTGYTFDGWWTTAEGGTQVMDSTTVTNASDHTIYAHWTANKYNVTFNYNYPSEIGASPEAIVKQIAYDAAYSTVIPSIEAPTGYEFVGWFTESTDGTQINASELYTLTTEQTFYAHWNKLTDYVIVNYVVYNADGTVNTELATINTSLGNSYSYNYSVDGYTLSSWKDDNDNSSVPLDAVVGSTITAKATLSPITYTVRYETNGGTAVDNTTATYDTAFVLPKSSMTGYTLKWNINGTQHDPETSVSNLTTTANSTITATAVWSPITYTVTFTVNGGSSVSNITATYNKTFTLPTSTKTGYTLTWNVNGTSYDAGTNIKNITTESNATVTIEAVWIANKYTVIFNGNGSTSGSMDEQPFTYDESKILSSNGFEREGYTFLGWSTNPNDGTATYTDKQNVVNLTTTNNGEVTLYAVWEKNSSSGGGCLAAGTLITMADGSQKKVEDLTVDDYVLVFNHETGRYQASKILFIDYDGWAVWDVIYLEFDNGTTSRIIYEHGFFDRTLNKYIYIDEYNMSEFIGHEFATAQIDGTTQGTGTTRLVNAYVVQEYTGCYSPTTVYHLNLIADGLLSMPGGIEGMFNFFDYDSTTLAYDQEAMQQDIATYGLMTYDDFAQYMSYEVYCCFPAQYIGVSLGKGLMTEEYLQYLIERYVVGMGLEETVPETNTPTENTTTNTDVAEATLPPPVVIGDEQQVTEQSTE